MARSNDRDRNPKRAPKEARPRGKRKVCVFCKERTEWVDYKDVNLLRRFMSERGKIRSRRVTGRPRPAPGREDAVEVEDGVGAEEAMAYDIDADLGPELAEAEA